MQDGNLIVDHEEWEAGAPEMNKIEKTGTYKVGREHEGVNSLRAELAARSVHDVPAGTQTEALSPGLYQWMPTFFLFFLHTAWPTTACPLPRLTRALRTADRPSCTKLSGSTAVHV